jgi:sulfide:quinone oxidoreductase
MFGRTTLDAVRLPYARFVKLGVRLLREAISEIDPAARRVTTDAGIHDCDYLVVALSAGRRTNARPRRANARCSCMIF